VDHDFACVGLHVAPMGRDGPVGSFGSFVSQCVPSSTGTLLWS
jgi:hypothetical protein